MITKGIITKIPINPDDNKYLVRLPFFEDATENAEEIIYEATLNEAPGIKQGYAIGDVVYVAFEDNDEGKPVIIGKLYSTEIENIGAEIDTNNLVVNNSTKLSANTTIGDATKSDVANIKNIKNKLDKSGGTVSGLLTLGNTVQFTSGMKVDLVDDGEVTKSITADELLSGGSAENYVLKSGDTMTGELTLPEITVETSSSAANRVWSDGNTIHFKVDEHGYSGYNFVFHKANGTTVSHDVASWMFDSGSGVSAVTCPYDILDLWITTSTANPESKWPGTTWEQLSDRFLIGAGNLYSLLEVGGETEHTLTTEEIPSHTHKFQYSNGSQAYQQYVSNARYINNTPESNYWNFGTNIDNEGNSLRAQWANNGYEQGGLVGNTGGSQAHNNMPPYLGVYIWRRIG